MNSHLSLVNQKFGFANSILSFLDDLPEIESSRQKIQRQALCESVLHHIYVAFHFYLRELAENNGVKNADAIETLQSLVSALSQLGKSPSEVLELQDIANDKDSWLRALLGLHDQILKSPPRKVEKKAFGSENLIELIELDQKENFILTDIDPRLLKTWVEKFKVLVMRQRETGAEY